MPGVVECKGVSQEMERKVLQCNELLDASDKVSQVANNGSVHGDPRLRPVTKRADPLRRWSLLLLQLLTRQHDFMHRHTIAPQPSVHRASSAPQSIQPLSPRPLGFPHPEQQNRFVCSSARHDLRRWRCDAETVLLLKVTARRRYQFQSSPPTESNPRPGTSGGWSIARQLPHAGVIPTVSSYGS